MSRISLRRNEAHKNDIASANSLNKFFLKADDSLFPKIVISRYANYDCMTVSHNVIKVGTDNPTNRHAEKKIL